MKSDKRQLARRKVPPVVLRDTPEMLSMFPDGYLQFKAISISNRLKRSGQIMAHDIIESCVRRWIFDTQNASPHGRAPARTVQAGLDDVRLICSKCGACAGHPEDRDGNKCRHCGERATVAQERDSSGAWVTSNARLDRQENA